MATVREAVEAGITFLDVAPTYGNGDSYPYVGAHAYQHAQSDSNSNVCANTDFYSCTNIDAHSNSYEDADPYYHPNAYHNSYSNGYAYTNAYRHASWGAPATLQPVLWRNHRRW